MTNERTLSGFFARLRCPWKFSWMKGNGEDDGVEFWHIERLSFLDLQAFLADFSVFFADIFTSFDHIA